MMLSPPKLIFPTILNSQRQFTCREDYDFAENIDGFRPTVDTDIRYGRGD
ncbi:hypothetical protein TOL_0245 [Thalassolituus oleivorans MIL-1]|jgi:hypothetical protein|uniref:Uncharacterized protein n=1 Tax=Thalassolituus oleivorans MIL-1 TaxID=1298593 RepID=M5DMR7_9GAMM|nr:hypothetical protein TOL_0245 [Thalassolituus oleivorans MIL-1]